MLFDKVKLALRASGTAFDAEITDLIEAAIADLRRVGIIVTEIQEEGSPVDVGDPLLIRAIILYAKAESGFYDTDDAERYRNAYDHLQCALSLSEDYIESEGG